MYRDAKQWQEIRRRVLSEGVSRRQIIRETGIHWDTLQRILSHPLPLRYSRGSKMRSQPKPDRRQSKSLAQSQSSVWDDLLESLNVATVGDSRAIITALRAVSPSQLSEKKLKALQNKLLERGIVKSRTKDCMPHNADEHWLLDILQGQIDHETGSLAVGDASDFRQLIDMARDGNLNQRNRALSILALKKGISQRRVAAFLRVSPSTVGSYWKRYREHGLEGLMRRYRSSTPKKADQAEIRDAVFSILHSPPSDHDINRTTWKMDDLRDCLAASGYSMSKDTIRSIIRSAGYRWRKARIVLTSPDPQYREKLSHIQTILSNLESDERFFSIDEFGPFAIKMKGGRRLVAPDDYRYVPQLQKSKGFLIVTAALELSRNQVTHFYSWKKNTVEMLRLLHLLLDHHKQCRKLYFSWDAASWHSSKRLYKEVEKVNSDEYRSMHGTPCVELAPLPASAQFLNVIESVFSGLARAIIHNSNYASKAEARQAIDRYFEERNEHFRCFPKPAGKKIWGKEVVASGFGEGKNCKNPKWR